MPRGRGHWRIVGYDGAGAPMRARVGRFRAEPVAERTLSDRPHREALRALFERHERDTEDRDIRAALGVTVR